MRVDVNEIEDIQYKPKYAMVRDRLELRIRELDPGDRLPPEPMLCKEYEVSRITLRRAVDDLIRDGLLVREQGRGTFVTQPTYTQQIRETFADKVTGFHRQQTELGRTVDTHVLSNRVVRDAAAARALKLPIDTELVELDRMRYVNGSLHQHVLTYLSASKYPGVLAHDFTHGSLYDFLEVNYGVVLTQNDLLVRVESDEDRSAELLGAGEGESYLAIESTVFAGDLPVAYGIARHTPQNSEIAITLKNVESADR